MKEGVVNVAGRCRRSLWVAVVVVVEGRKDVVVAVEKLSLSFRTLGHLALATISSSVPRLSLSDLFGLILPFLTDHSRKRSTPALVWSLSLTVFSGKRSTRDIALSERRLQQSTALQGTALRNGGMAAYPRPRVYRHSRLPLPRHMALAIYTSNLARLRRSGLELAQISSETLLYDIEGKHKLFSLQLLYLPTIVVCREQIKTSLLPSHLYSLSYI